MKSLLVLAALAGAAHADSLDAIVRAQVEPALPDPLGVVKVFAPAGDFDPAKVTVELPRELRAGRPSVKVTIGFAAPSRSLASSTANPSPRSLAAGAAGGKRTLWVPVAIAAMAEVAITNRAIAKGQPITAADVTIERRAGASRMPANVVGSVATHDLAAGAELAARDLTLPPPLPRGTQVTVEIRRGSVRVRGTATLELAARPGDPATARLQQTKTLVHGTLVAPATVVAGDTP